ncbi:MAG: prepilin-type N-terminal cleavage/methylation domain-containing protein [Prosthecobacter sp.]|nr:prepilin-type N-terminal cleavage/methylation domain-containing protein [Prosthecobacter sp.]
MKRALQRGFTLIELLVVITIIAIIASLAVPTYNLITVKANQMKGASNCRQIISLLLNYASENNGLYPDSITNPITGSIPLTSNDAFRALVQEGSVQDETIFGCPGSRFMPDKNIGIAPTYDQALTAGENHWAMTAGQSNTTSSIMPIVFENPAAAGWPPQWNCDAAGKPVPGRAWPGGKIIVGKNDASVETVKLMSQTGASVGPRLLGSGFDMFTMASPNQPQQILNIVVSGTASYTDPNALPGGLPQAPGYGAAPGGDLPQLPGGAPGALPQLPGGAPAAPGGGLPALPGAPQQ